METWKALLGVSVVLVVFGIIVAGTDMSLSGPAAIGLLIVAAVASGLFYVVSKRGYRMGRQIGEQMSEDE